MSLKRKPPEGNVRRVAPIGQNSRGNMTNKAGKRVQFESFAEHVYALRLDRDQTVKDYQSQPLRIPFDDPEKKGQSYTPDFMVWRHNGQIEIHEITRTERQSRTCIQLREKAAQKFCQEKGWQYLIYNEKSLPQVTEATNLLFLYAYRPTIYFNNQVAEEVLRQLDEQRKVPLRVLVNNLVQLLDLPIGTALPALYHLLWHGKIATDLQTMLALSGLPSAHTMVWRNQEDV